MKRNNFFLERDLSEMVTKGEAKYFIVNVLAKRAKALHSGEKAQVKVEDGREPDNIAIEEVRQNKLKVLPKKHTPKMVNIIESDDR
jgi:DNA-directed RNA polymerase subunit K/omega